MSGQPIIIKKVSKHAHGHHGGAWKVAYADFVTAMMAFFLLLWLLNAVTKEQLEGISDYFAPISKQTSTSGGGSILQGEVIAEKGVFNSPSRDVKVAQQRQPFPEADKEAEEGATDVEAMATTTDPAEAQAERTSAAQRGDKGRIGAAKEIAAVPNDDALFAAVQTAVTQAFDEHPDLKPLANSLLMENTPEGLRIQIIDQDGLPMFPRGQAVMYQYTRRVLEIVANAIRRMPQQIEISGHTDATPFASSATYGNWELSADRANAARRVLVEQGLTDSRVERVVGRAATEPLLPQTPDAAGNRRLTIMLLRGTGPH